LFDVIPAGRTPSHSSMVSHSVNQHSTGDCSADVMVVEVTSSPSSVAAGLGSAKSSAGAASVDSSAAESAASASRKLGTSETPSDISSSNVVQ
jgi:hypothetical protein